MAKEMLKKQICIFISVYSNHLNLLIVCLVVWSFIFLAFLYFCNVFFVTFF